MIIEQIYTGCLAQGAYYIESNGEAAIIDPLREVEPYIEMAKSRNAKIKFVFETHFHADFVSGHVDLANKTGATIVFGPTTMQTGFKSFIGSDGEIFNLGNVKIKLIHTPGHTLESSCYLLIDEEGNEKAIFTGDTLFIGDVGRPDLAQHVIADLTEEKLAALLYDSLHNKLMPLNDNLIIYPAHGAGSACGKKMSKETSDTLGNQKQTNYALNKSLSKSDFIKEVLHGLTPPPFYFPKNVVMNITGYDSIDNVMQRGTKAYTANEFEIIANETNSIILDTRSAESFAKGFIPNSINIGIDGNFAVWVGTLITDIKQSIILVIEPGREEEVITRLARVGYDSAIGYLKGGFETWIQANKEIETIKSTHLNELSIAKKDINFNLIDVRKKSEYDSEHVIDAINAPLDYINEGMQLIDKTKTYYVHCAAGYRSMIFVSILKARGYNNLINVEGGFNAIKNSNQFAVTSYVTPTTLL